MKLKAITIDFWNTIFDSSNGTERNSIRQRALIQEIDKYDIMIKQDQFQEAMKASWEYFNTIWKRDCRTPSSRELVGFFWNYLKLPEAEESVDNVVKVFANSILDAPPKLLPGAKETISKLSSIYKLGIVSDTGFSPGKILFELLEKEGIAQYITAFSFSDETGVSKPHPDAFLKALDILGFSPLNALHIGDIEATDIIGAKQLGMMAIRFCGDPTDFVNSDNSKRTQADVELQTWQEIFDFIKKLQIM
jgi:putative hydrolase of the HAD superfamily